MSDLLEIIGDGTLIQHGKQNNRVYLMKLDKRDIDFIIPAISQLAELNAYSKLFCKVPKSLAPHFFANGFVLEAFIPKFYNNKEDVFFVAKFLNAERLMNIETRQLNALSNLLASSPKVETIKKESSDFTIRALTKNDVERITEIYKQVFETYPFPIHDPAYILKTMDEDVQYFGAEKEGKLVALSSAEIDFKGANAEMTDFATDPAYAGNGLAIRLLKKMEVEMKKQNITSLYTIARLNSIAMNKTFLKNAYQYSGTLIKNTDIAGKIESMNVYYKLV